MLKSHGAGKLRASNAGTEVTLAGWVHARRDHGGVIFLDLRDASGIVQVVSSSPEAHRVRDEWCVLVRGCVRPRPDGTVNPSLPTGKIEVAATSIEVLSESPPVPFAITDEVDAEEPTRLRYRFLDLRRPVMLETLKTRAVVTKVMRRVLERHDFIEIETPLLALSTPEGARDYLVPSRLSPGSFYALVQSPQLFKQILMVAGVERYYQIARCLRDEDGRADRQPEHTQLDLEMSFVERDDVLTLVEEIFSQVWQECLDVAVESPFERLAFDDAIARFGTDKPDLRAGPEVTDLTDVFSSTEFKAFSGSCVKGLRVPAAAALTRSRIDALIERAKELGAAGLVWMVAEPDELKAPVAKFMSAEELSGIRSQLGLQTGDLVLLVSGDPVISSQVLGTLRVELAREQGRVISGSDPAEWKFLWIVDYPLFEEKEGRFQPAHNPFCAPTSESLDLVESDPRKARSQQYDLVLNGNELLSGSIRINRPEVQARVFQTIGMTPDEAQKRFGFFLNALQYAAPPHGGVGIGLDRIVMLLRGTFNIRDVTAFPKTQSAADLMTGAPAPVDEYQLRELGIRLRK